jgi:hypothetical protein
VSFLRLWLSVIFYVYAKCRYASRHSALLITHILVVRSDVEGDGQRLLRLDSGQGGVQGQLADRDTHAMDTLKQESWFNQGTSIKLHIFFTPTD